MKQSKESKLEYVVKKVRRDIAQMHVCMEKKNAPIAWQSRLLKKSSSTENWKSALRVCSAENVEVKLLDFMTEIKASEFYKAIEEEESREKEQL